jgi:hypothetical protein
MKIRSGGLRQEISIEHGRKVAVPLDPEAGRPLKLCLGQLRFDQKISDAEVYLGALDVICDEWDARLAAELEALRRVGPEQEPKGAIRRKSSRMTKNIHQKRVGTSGGV